MHGKAGFGNGYDLGSQRISPRSSKTAHGDILGSTPFPHPERIGRIILSEQSSDRKELSQACTHHCVRASSDRLAIYLV